MLEENMAIRIGTRSSNLAQWQAQSVASVLNNEGIETEIIPLRSLGDRSLGGNLSTTVGQFVHFIDEQLLNESIDIAVHSSKDVPVELSKQIRNLAYMKRGVTSDLFLFKRKNDDPDLFDVLDGNDVSSLDDVLQRIPSGMTFGTVSGRRQSIVLSKRPDLIPLSVRGHVETRLKRLVKSRVDALVLAETGIQRLRTTGVLDTIQSELTAFRIDSTDLPTAPGQGAVCIHCKEERYEEFQTLRKLLNHETTETAIQQERSILQQVGGGCLYPAGIEVRGKRLSVRISPRDWKTTFCEGRPYEIFSYDGPLDAFELKLPPDTERPVMQPGGSNPKFISTLNSDRISLVLANNGIEMTNVSVIELEPNLEAWPKDFLQQYTSKREWPYLVLTSPFAAKCALRAAATNPDIARIQWLAIGEGTARACFRGGVTVAICAKARNSEELFKFIATNIGIGTKLLIPRSSVAPTTLVDQLLSFGFSVQNWIGYENKAKVVEQTPVMPEDVLLLSSSSSAISWAENNLTAPNEIICMGSNTRDTILSLDHFRGCNVSVLKGPTTEYLIEWWNKNRRE